jgi:hypothetical protein
VDPSALSRLLAQLMNLATATKPLLLVVAGLEKLLPQPKSSSPSPSSSGRGGGEESSGYYHGRRSPFHWLPVTITNRHVRVLISAEGLAGDMGVGQGERGAAAGLSSASGHSGGAAAFTTAGGGGGGGVGNAALKPRRTGEAADCLGLLRSRLTRQQALQYERSNFIELKGLPCSDAVVEMLSDWLLMCHLCRQQRHKEEVGVLPVVRTLAQHQIDAICRACVSYSVIGNGDDNDGDAADCTVAHIGSDAIGTVILSLPSPLYLRMLFDQSTTWRSFDRATVAAVIEPSQQHQQQQPQPRSQYVLQRSVTASIHALFERLCFVHGTRARIYAHAHTLCREYRGVPYSNAWGFYV